MNTARNYILLIFVKFEMANLNLDDDFVPFFSFFLKWKGRKYFLRNGKTWFLILPWLLLSIEETCQP